MRSRLLQNSAFIGLGVLIGLIASPLIEPGYKSAMIWFVRDSYGELVFRCDNAMRDHLIAKHEVIQRPSSEAIAALESAEVGLIDCQDYDIHRKRLIQFGLDENDLSLLGLYAIERANNSLPSVVNVHEIKR